MRRRRDNGKRRERFPPPMDYQPLTKDDEDLIDAATEVIRENYVRGKHHVGAAVRGASGRIFRGVHLESSGIDTCAEPVAFGTAAANGERGFQAVVAVTLNDGREPRILSPCGVCRELITFYGPDIEVIFVEDGEVRKARARDLLPGPYADS